MNRKGFTLVELIAMMVVIGILVAIAVPNISGIVKKNRESIGIEDINKMIGNAKTSMETGKIETPKTGECVILTLKSIDNNNDFTTGINGGEYDRDQSFVVIAKETIDDTTKTSTFKYYYRLVEEKQNGSKMQTFTTQKIVTDEEYGDTYTVYLADYDDFAKNPDDYMPKLEKDSPYIDLNSTSTMKSFINHNNEYGRQICTKVIAIHRK